MCSWGEGRGIMGSMKIRYDVEVDQLPELNRALREHRIQGNLVQQQLAQSIRFSNGAVGLVECGAWIPSDIYIINVCQVLGLSLAEEQRLLALRAGMPPKQKRSRWPH
jgi:transcriptional regulator with XRE-family HTH domain